MPALEVAAPAMELTFAKEQTAKRIRGRRLIFEGSKTVEQVRGCGRKSALLHSIGWWDFLKGWRTL